MENASKALIMAGSVLISIMIIGALVFTFRLISNMKQTDENAKQNAKLVEVNQELENRYARSGLYGSEIISLCNFVLDYNDRYNEENGYSKITVKVQLQKAKTDSYGYGFKKNYTSYQTLINDFSKLNSRVETLKNKKYFGQLLEKLANQTSEMVEEAKQGSSPTVIANYEKDLQEYIDLKAELTEFKNTKFKEPKVIYDTNNGRITEMTYEEITK